MKPVTFVSCRLVAYDRFSGFVMVQMGRCRFETVLKGCLEVDLITINFLQLFVALNRLKLKPGLL